jgi:hypothetical protein
MSCELVIGRSGGKRKDSDDVKSIEAHMSLSISSGESKITERLLLLLFVVVFVPFVEVLLLSLLILLSKSKD